MPDECDEFSSQILDQLKQGKLKNQLNESVFVENQFLTMHEDVIDNAMIGRNSPPVTGRGQGKKNRKNEPDLQHMLRVANTEIKMAMYRIARVVDAGDYHKVLMPSQPTELTITEKIPMGCKVDLTGLQCPLIIHLSKAPIHLTLLASFKNSEPTEDDHDFKISSLRKIVIVEKSDPKPNQKKDKFKLKANNEQLSFKSQTLYISLLSETSMQLRISIAFPNSAKLAKLQQKASDNAQ